MSSAMGVCLTAAFVSIGTVTLVWAIWAARHSLCAGDIDLLPIPAIGGALGALALVLAIAQPWTAVL